MEPTWTTYRPDSRYLRSWLLATSSAFILLATVFTFIDLEAGLLLWFIFPVLTATLWAILVRVRFRYNDQQIQQRYFQNIERSWIDANGWSCFSTAGRLHLYIRFSDGVVLGSTSLILSRSEILELIPLLMSKIGEPERGGLTILPPPPWPFRALHTTPLDESTIAR